MMLSKAPLLVGSEGRRASQALISLELRGAWQAAAGEHLSHALLELKDGNWMKIGWKARGGSHQRAAGAWRSGGERGAEASPGEQAASTSATHACDGGLCAT